MKADEIVDDAMIRTAHEAYDAPGIWGRDESMRAALLAVVPLFAERFAKIAEGERCVVAGDVYQTSGNGHYWDADSIYGTARSNAASDICASVKDRSPETQKPAVTPKGITAAE